MNGDDRIMTGDELLDALEDGEALERELIDQRAMEERLLWDTAAVQVLAALVDASNLKNVKSEDADFSPARLAAMLADDLLDERRKRFPQEG